MSVRYWDGDTDTDWATATNWSGNALPVTADEVIFDGRQVTKPTTGMTDGGVGHSGKDTASTFDLLHFKSTYTGGIGTAALPCTLSPSRMIIEGSGTYYINCGKNDQSTNATIATTIINNPDAIVYLFSNANDGANTCKFTNVHLIAGTLYLSYYTADTDDQGVYVANLYMSPRNNDASNATVIIEKDCYDVSSGTGTNIYMENGILSTDSQVEIFEVHNGTVFYGSERNLGTEVVETSLNIIALRLYGGTFYWQPDDSGDNAYIRNLWIYGGMFDASGDISKDRAKKLGFGSGYDIHLFAGGTIDISNGMGNIKIATSSQLWNFGGTLIIDDGAQIAISYDQP